MSQAKRMLKHSSIYAIGNISRQLVGFIMLPVYTRYLTPADYGVVGLLILMVGLIEILFGARMFQAVPKFYYEQDSKERGHTVISTALMITSAVSLLTVAAVMYFRNPISEIVFGTGEFSFVVAVFGVLILTQALENYTLGYIRIQQRPWLFIGASSAKLFLQLGLNVWLVVFREMGVMGVALSNVSASIIFTGGMTIYTLWNTGTSFDKQIAKKMLIFSWPIWLSGIAGLYVGSSNRYFIRLFSSLDDVGLFALAAKFGTIITVLIWSPFSQYWQIERFNLYHKSNPLSIYRTVFTMISAVMFLAALGVAVFAGPVIRIMAAPEFHDAVRAVPYLSFAAVFSCFTYFNNFSFLVKEKTKWMTYNSYVTAVVITVFYFALIPLFGFVGAAQALLIAHGVQYLLSHYLAKRCYDMQLALTPVMGYCLISVATLYVSDQLVQEAVFTDLFVKIAIYSAASLLFAALLLTNTQVRGYVTGFLQRQFGFGANCAARRGP